MRADQFEKLVELQETLMDVFLAEVKPDEWPGAGIHIREMSAPQRGDRLWCKKNASHTLSLVTKLSQIIVTERRVVAGDPTLPDDDSIQSEADIQSTEDRMIDDYEALATDTIRHLVKRSRE